MYYPTIDPILISIGPVAIRWYGVSYVAAFVVCYLLGKHRVKRFSTDWSIDQWGDLLFYGIIGTLVGGRIGYAVFYGWETLTADPLWLLRIWEGGMSFHGGLCGVILTLFIFAKKKRTSFLSITDFVAPLVSIGIGFGRIGNFANTELPGRVTESVLGVHFPCHAVMGLNPMCLGEYETLMRHVSSLYQAIVTGIIVFTLVWLYSSKQRPLGTVSGLFLLLYGVGRFFTEFFRQPDIELGFIRWGWLTMGQILSIPLIVLGAIFLLPNTSRYFACRVKT